jgi:hypothetical protein
MCFRPKIKRSTNPTTLHASYTSLLTPHLIFITLLTTCWVRLELEKRNRKLVWTRFVAKIDNLSFVKVKVWNHGGRNKLVYNAIDIIICLYILGMCQFGYHNIKHIIHFNRIWKWRWNGIVMHPQASRWT